MYFINSSQFSCSKSRIMTFDNMPLAYAFMHIKYCNKLPDDVNAKVLNVMDE